MNYYDQSTLIEEKKQKIAKIGLLIIVPLVAFLIYKSLNSKKALKFSQLSALVHDAATITYRGHEYGLFMVNGEILAPVHDAACKECNKLNINLEE